jgi:hypothetical protein
MQLFRGQYVAPPGHPPLTSGDRGVESLPLITREAPEIVGVRARIYHIRSMAIQAELLVKLLTLPHQFGWERVSKTCAPLETTDERRDDPESHAEEPLPHIGPSWSSAQHQLARPCLLLA